jgi:hypothetical protein
MVRMLQPTFQQEPSTAQRAKVHKVVGLWRDRAIFQQKDLAMMEAAMMNGVPFTQPVQVEMTPLSTYQAAMASLPPPEPAGEPPATPAQAAMPPPPYHQKPPSPPPYSAHQEPPPQYGAEAQGLSQQGINMAQQGMGMSQALMPHMPAGHAMPLSHTRTCLTCPQVMPCP